MSTDGRDDDGASWREIREWVANAGSGHRTVQVLQSDRQSAERQLEQLKLSPRSYLGSVVCYTGGILVDCGWLRILGSGHEELERSLLSWNQAASKAAPAFSDALLVADDVLGGFFAINGGGLPGPLGNACYLAPDTQEWEDLEVTYGSFLAWAFSERLDEFYEPFRWSAWKNEIPPPHQCVHFHPPLWAEGDMEERSRRPVSIDESWRLAING